MLSATFTFISGLLIALLTQEHVPIAIKIGSGLLAGVLLLLASCPLIERAATALRSPNVQWAWAGITAGVRGTGRGGVAAARWIIHQMSIGRSKVEHWVEIIYLSLMQALFLLTAACGITMFVCGSLLGKDNWNALIASVLIVGLLAVLRPWIDLNVAALRRKRLGWCSRLLLRPIF